MKVLVTTFILLVYCSTLFAQSLKPERRIYMLDATSSMESLKTSDSKVLWSVVTKSLSEAINSIEDPNTEIVVVPFWESILDVWEVKATPEGKKNIIDKISALKTGGKTTNISEALSKGYDLLNKDRVNYLFLLTDGTHNTPNTDSPVKIINQWNNKIANTDSYCFYVMLHKDAKNDNIVDAINENRGMWVVESADINVNILRFDDKVNFNPRIDTKVILPITGLYKRVNNSIKKIETNSNPYYDVKLVDGNLQNGEVVIEIINKEELSRTPELYPINITLVKKSNDDFTYVIPDVIKINCNNKHERVLKITPKP